MNDHPQLVIVGGGIAGASIAYHLARLGYHNVLVLDAGKPMQGTTGHAPGLVGQLRSSVSLTKMLMYSVELYGTLELDGTPGFQPVGSLRLASSPERLLELKRQAGFAAGIGLQAHLLSAAEAVQLAPLLNPAGLEGALYLPDDGSALAPILAMAMIREARRRGVTVQWETPVTGIEVVDGHIRAVLTPEERIPTETLVVAAGVWSPIIARMAGVSLPLTAFQHQYMSVGPIEGLNGTTIPNVRDPDRLVYVRQLDNSLVLGGYERNPETFDVSDYLDRLHPTILEFDAHRFEPLYDAIVERAPAAEGGAVERCVNGIEAFTPDGEFLLGPSSEVKGCWAACGFCAHGVSGAGGAGKMMAEWIVSGEPSLDLWHMDLRRFGQYASGSRYIQGRAREVYSTYYDILYPFYERTSMRKLRLSPVYEQTRALGAKFGEKAGWERPNWFEPNAAAATGDHVPRGWPGRNWSPAIGVEHRATRERAGLFDVTSFSKLEVWGRDALPFLQYQTDNEMDKPAGSITYTQLLNDSGGIECDLTVTRLAPDRFMLITGAAFGTHDLAWLLQHLPEDGSVYAADVTSSRCAIGLWGPRARDILQSVSDDDLSNGAFPYLTARHIRVGPIPVLALRVTYVGELGWELYAPAEYGVALWQTLWEAGQGFGIVPAGYRAIESLRLEKGYRYWSADIQSEYNPYEAGLGFAVRLDKGPFMGRGSLLHALERGLQRKLCCLVLDDPTVETLGGEPIYAGDQVVGRVTSGGYGYTVERSIAYGYVDKGFFKVETDLEVLWFGERIGATVVREPLYDPANARVKEVEAVAAVM